MFYLGSTLMTSNIVETKESLIISEANRYSLDGVGHSRLATVSKLKLYN